MKKLSKEIKESLVTDFQVSFCPFGYLDIERAVTVFHEVDLTPDDLVEAVSEFCDSTEVDQSAVDVVYVAYDKIFQDVRYEVEEATGKDILNDTKKQINVYGNYMCSQFDFSKEAKEEFLEIVSEIPEEDRSIKLKWMLSEIE